MSLENVEDIYPLSPMQEIMLFHACRPPPKKQTKLVKQDVLFNQAKFNIQGNINLAFFEHAWQTLIDRHPALRTAFMWEGLKQPKQIVRAKLNVPFKFTDIRQITVEAQKSLLDDIYQKDKLQGFIPEKAPLMRVHLIALANTEYELIWSSHHLALDRWCIPILFDELFSSYQALVDGNRLTLPKADSFKAYISWLNKRDNYKSNLYWIEKLAGFRQQTFLTKSQKSQHPIVERAIQQFDLQETHQLKLFCKTHRITMANLIQGGWALILNHYNKISDVMFGIVVSGRPPNLSGVEEIIGSFVNNIPVRVQFSEIKTTIEWLKDIQKDGFNRSEHEHLPVTKLQSLTELPEQQSLFDSILVWLAPTKVKQLKELRIKPHPSEMSTNYPLTLSIEETDTGITIELLIEAHSESIESPQVILSKLKNRLMSISCVDENHLLSDFSDIVCHNPNTELNKTDCNSINFLINQKASFDSTKKTNTKLGREETKLEWLIDFLITECQKILDINKIDLDDDFFALGGTSIKAAQLLAKIENAERKKIPILSLFTQPTIRQMAKTISEKKWPLNPQIVTALNKNGTKKPLFCIASPDVNTLGYANLSNELAIDIPCYVIQSPPEFNAIRSLEASDIPRIATTYINAMKKVQANGPYQLFGMCTGAQITFEMARQIEASGEQCAFVGIANTWAFYTVSKKFKYQIFEDKVRHYLNYYKERFKTLNLAEAKHIIKKKGRKLFGVVTEEQTPQTSLPIQSGDEHDDRIPYSLINTVGWAHLSPEITKISQKVTVFRCKKQIYWRIPMTCLGWTKHANNVEIVHIKGKQQMEILRHPNICDIAKKIQTRLL